MPKEIKVGDPITAAMLTEMLAKIRYFENITGSAPIRVNKTPAGPVISGGGEGGAEIRSCRSVGSRAAFTTGKFRWWKRDPGSESDYEVDSEIEFDAYSKAPIAANTWYFAAFFDGRWQILGQVC